MFQKHPYPGTYIAFEGGEGAGKSVQIHWLWKQLQELCPDRRVVKVFEPGGTKAGNLIRELGFDFVWEVNKPAVGRIIPDRILLLDVDPAVGLGRKQRDGLPLDRIETADLAFHQKARKGYLALVGMFPKIFIKIDGKGSIEQVREVVLEQTLRCIEGKRIEGAIRRERE